MPEHGLTSLADARLDPYRDLKRTNLTRWSGQFIAEGWRVVERLLSSEFEVESVLVSQRRRETIAPRVPPNLPLLVVPQILAESLLGYNFHAGVLACGRRKPAISLDALFRKVGEPAADRMTIVLCDRIIRPDNLGALIRLGAAFGVTAIVIGPGSADPFSRRVLRVSMGQAFRMPILESADLSFDLRELRDQHAFELAAAVAASDAEPLAAARRGERLALVFGNEAEGIDPAVRSLCQRRLTIPIDLEADSLNVAVAAGIILHALR